MAMTPHMVTIDCADPAALTKFWSAAAGYEVRWQADDFVVLGPAQGTGIQIGLQRVPEARVGKNRVHIDWETDDRLAEVGRLTGLGARVLDEQSLPGFRWTVLADPEGNEFCVSAAG
jgi:catechol 2,3-dioxygenase-like lactoylglutathione lyase family enzyme